MGERRGMKALELWCKRVTDGYQGVKVENMTTSWRDGLAFCAIIHHFRPELIDFGSLNKADILGNNELAFRTAEHHLGIPALLDAEDMVEFSVPDRLSILTYLSQFYQAFAGSRQSMSPSPKRTTPVSKRTAGPAVMSPDSQATPTKMLALGSKRREPCAKCAMPVFIAERLLVGGRKLYHRTCFRCARCQHQLSLANCYETEDGSYCCEACPDEVDNVPSVVEAPSSDIVLSENSDLITETESESVVLSFPSVEIKHDAALSNFMIGQLQWEDQEVAPPLPTSAPPLPASSDNSVDALDNSSFSYTETSATNAEAFKSDINNSNLEHLDEGISPDFCTKTNLPESVISSKFGEEVPLEISIKPSISDNQPLTANDELEDCFNDQNELITNSTKEARMSIVKLRMQMFDGNLQDKDPKFLANRKSKNAISTEKIVETVAIMPTPEAIDTSVAVSEKAMDDIVTQTKLETLDDVTSEDIETKVNTIASIVDSITPEVIDNPNTRIVVEALETDTDIFKTSEQVQQVDILTEDTNETSSPASDDHTSGKIDSIVPCDDIKVHDNDSNTFHDIDKKDDFDKKDDLDALEEVEIMIVSPPVPDVVDSIVLNTPLVTDKSLKEVQVDNELETNVIEVPDIDTNQCNDIIPVPPMRKDSKEVYPTELNPFGDDSQEEDSKETGTNPFGSSDDENQDQPIRTVPSALPRGKPPRPPQPISRQSLTLNSKKVTEDSHLKIAANPFWSDGEEPSSDDDSKPKRVPVPLPRTTVKSTTPEPSPMPRLRRNSGAFGSVNSVSSADSSTGNTLRHKKKHAPPPPVPDSASPSLPVSSPPSLPTSSPSQSTASSPRARPRKARPAPPPPSDENQRPLRKIEVYPPIECEKFEKDEINRNRQSNASDSPFMIAANKSMYGQWKRKKGPAPPRPVPQRREIRAMPMKDVKRELDDIDVKQLELERQGVSVEKTIRSKFEDTPLTDDSSSAVTPDLEDLVMQLFEIVNEKNELFRRQAELMYLRRQHRLEEEHADLEYEIRCLMDRPEHTKTDTEKAYEEQLIRRLVDIVERRDEIVNCLEMDRQREVEEDRSIHEQMASFAAKGKGSETDMEKEGTLSEKKSTLKLLKKKVKKSKEKLIKKNQGTNVDSEKEVDESESGKKMKEKKSKHKWF